MMFMLLLQKCQTRPLCGTPHSGCYADGPIMRTTTPVSTLGAGVPVRLFKPLGPPQLHRFVDVSRRAGAAGVLRLPRAATRTRQAMREPERTLGVPGLGSKSRSVRYSQAVEKREKPVRGAEAPGTGRGRRDLLQGSLFHRQVGLDVSVCRARVDVSEPERDRGKVDACL
jgi:hypothetical protein